MSVFSSETERDLSSYILGLILLLVIAGGIKILQDYTTPADSITTNIGTLALGNGKYTLKQLDQQIAEAKKKKAILELRKARHRKLSDLQQIAHDKKVILISLTAQVSPLQKSLNTLAKEKSEYRKTRHNRLRQSYLNKSFDTFTTRSGKTFQQVTIRKFDDIGMGITHGSGSSRISVFDLPNEIRQRFDFSVTEVDQALKKERIAQSTVLPKKPSKKTTQADDSQSAQLIIEEARTALHKILSQISSFEAKKNHALSEATSARAQARYSRTRSGPSGLETWEERAHRFDKLALQYARKLAELQVMQQQTLRIAYPD